MKSRITLLTFIAVIAVWLLPVGAFAQYTVETVSTEGVPKDFVLGPGKTELTLNPGESKVVQLLVTNRTGSDQQFELGVEDFTGSQNTRQTVVLLGNERGPYSLKDYLSFEARTFTLNHGERAIVPVTVSIPSDAEPGGLYGSVLVSLIPKKQDFSGQEVTGSNAIVTRLGSLFFVTVPGLTERDGALEAFDTIGRKRFFTEGPIPFQILYRNEGTIHVNPYGIVSIRNILGDVVGEVQIEPWFALPNSLRNREVEWGNSFLMGRYTATLELNRGYNDIVDTQTITFYVIPWTVILTVVGITLIILLFLKWIFSKFEFRKKEKKQEGQEN
ncbi:MAG: hypothetical protein WDZ88_01695 [Candidatus Paceibacterota bacterium]